MAITGKFLADFDDFYDAVRQAEVELKGMESESQKVEAQLNRMVDSFSGRKVVQQATIMVEAMERVGGITKLTEAEFRKLEKTVEDATLKLKAMGQTVPQNFKDVASIAQQAQYGIQTVGNAAETMGGKAGKAGDNLRAASRAAGLLGDAGTAAAIGRMASAFDLLNPSLTTTVGMMSKLLTAGAVLTAAKEGWKFGRQIAEFAGLDDIVAKNTARLLGWGDVVEQTAQAHSEMLAKASATAGREITSLTEAERINSDAVKAMGEEAKRAADQQKVLAVESAKARDEFLKRWEEDVRRRNEISKKLAEDERSFTNFIEERRIEDHQRAIDAMERTEREYRALQNEMGEIYLKLEGDRLKKLEDARVAALEAALKAEADFFEKELHGGMLITGMEPSSLLRPQPLDQTGVYLPSAAAPAGATMNVTVGNINGTGQQVAESLFQEIERRLKTTRKLPNA